MAGFVVALTLAPATSASTTSASTPAVAVPIDWHDCGGGFECGALQVPVDYSAPDGEQVGIGVIRKPATDPGLGHRSLVLNFGGPGVPGTETLRRAVDHLPAPIRAQFDLVSFDPRGTGSSRPVDCVDDPTFQRLWSEDGTPTSDADLPRFYDGTIDTVDITAACVAAQGTWLAHVGTRNVARDLDRLRAALGDDRLSYVGYSYGTVLGAVYAQLFPRRVRALVLDSAVNLSETGGSRLLGNAAGFEHALDAFLADCAAHIACDFHSDGDPRAALTSLRDRFEAGLTVPLADGRTVGVSEFYGALLAALYSRASWPALARGLHDAARNGTGKYLGLLDDRLTGRRDDGTYSNLQESIGPILCADRRDVRPSFADYSKTYHQLVAQYPFFGPVLGAFPTGCDPRLPAPPASETLGDVKAAHAPPVLVLGTTNDPATPYQGALDLRRRIRRSRILTINDTQHGGFAVGNACVDMYATAYLLDGTLPPRHARCEQ